MKFIKSSIVCYLLSIICAFAADLFFDAEPVQGGINVFDASDTFSEIYQKLDDVAWSGKNISVALEAIENINPRAQIAATDERVVLVWGDTIIASYPRPLPRDWDAFGEITTALVIKLREHDAAFAKLSQNAMYEAVVSALVRGINEGGRYIFGTDAGADDGKILTSVGIEGALDARGNFRVRGVYQGSPRDNSGIRDGDLITTINGASVGDDVMDALSGFNSGTLKLGLLTPAGDKNIVLRRASVVLADADIVARQETGDKRQGILEIIVHKISDNAVAIVNEAWAKHNPQKIILDMRAARGDDEIAAAKFAGLFLGQVPVMRVEERALTETEIVPGGNAITNAPVVVLVSNTTRGTAEIIAASFYENNRGVIVGTPTAGNARGATIIELSNGGALELMNKSLKTGRGNIIHGRGLFPIVCLSNIRSDSQQAAFFVNVINGEFDARDFNKDTEVSAYAVRRGCPVITSGADEDASAAAVAAKILTDDKVYKQLVYSH